MFGYFNLVIGYCLVIVSCILVISQVSFPRRFWKTADA